MQTPQNVHYAECPLHAIAVVTEKNHEEDPMVTDNATTVGNGMKHEEYFTASGDILDHTAIDNGKG